VEKIWLQQYPPDVPAEINVAEYASVKEIVEQSCARFPDKPAFSNMDKTLTFGELDRLSRDFGVYLQQTMGLQRGDRIALMLPNLLQYPIAVFGALRVGMTVVNVNPLYTARELEHQLKDSGARAIVILENFAHTLQEVLHNTRIQAVVTTEIGDMLSFPKNILVNFVVRYVKRLVPPWRIAGTIPFKQTLNQGRNQTLREIQLNHEDAAFLQYTGGTTGVAKGAVLTHGNMVANIIQAHAWIESHVVEGQEVIITALPLYHIFSLTANCLVFMKIGAHNVLITNPRDMTGFVKELSKVRFTAITGVSTLYNGLLNTPGFSDLDFGPLKIALGGGMAVQRAVAERWQQVTGTPLIEAYGLTETSPGVCINPLTLEAFNGSIGVPLPSTEVSIRDQAMDELPVGEVGEICVRGPQVMRGYWNRPQESAEVLTADGWFKTGDMGYIDEGGYVRIVDRKKDMILVSGFNVYPNEVEDVMMMHPGVLEAAAIGVSDEKSGEAVKGVVVKKDPALTAEDLIDHCKEHLAAYKVPRQIEFREELPKTNIGKILRRALRDETNLGVD
jgi:long-chain acyl-CoA synthetase